MNESYQVKLAKIHAETRKGLVPFFKIMLADLDDYQEPAPFHYEISDILLDKAGHFAVEMARETAKSTYVLKAFPLYKLTYPSDDCRFMVIIKQNQDLACSKLLEIIKEHENHPVLKRNIVQVNKRSAQAYEVVVRGMEKKNYTIRIEAYGKGSAIRGLTWNNLRPQIIIGDDLQSLEDSQSEAVQTKDWDWFLSDVKFLAKTSRLFIIGNNLGERCIIERIINEPKLNFTTLKIPLIINGESSWASRFPMEFLENEKKEFVALGKLEIWYRERMCVALPEEKQTFKKEYFRYFEQTDLPEQYTCYLTVDLAISEKKSADDVVVLVVGKSDNSPNWYILEYIGGKLDPLKTIDAIFKLYEKYRPVKVGIESVAYQRALSFFVKEEMKRREVYFNITELKNASQSKEERIKGLQPMFKTGVIKHRSNMIELETQLLSFPKGIHDDYLDALAMVLQLVETTTNSNMKTYKRGYEKYLDSLK